MAAEKKISPKTLHRNKAVLLFSDVERDSLRLKDPPGSPNRLYQIDKLHPGLKHKNYYYKIPSRSHDRRKQKDGINFRRTITF